MTIVVGEAMMNAMDKQGVDIERVNYQDMGNWSVFKKEIERLLKTDKYQDKEW